MVAELVPVAQLDLMHQLPGLHVRPCLPGNGYIEEKELESFFKELHMSWTGTDVVSSGGGATPTHGGCPGFTSTRFSLGAPKLHAEGEGEGVYAEV